MRKAEARRVTQPISISAEAHRNREAWRKRAIDERQKELMAAGLWPAPDDWAADLKVLTGFRLQAIRTRRSMSRTSASG